MTQQYYLTYFTNSTRAEFDDIVCDLKEKLPKNEIANLFIEKFNPNTLHDVYGIAITDKLEWAINHTLNHAIDTEMFIRYMFDKIDEKD